MQAIIRQGGKQYVVEKDTVFQVSRINDEAKEIKLEVLATYDDKGVNIGNPVLESAEVVAEIVEHSKGPKIDVRKYKSKNKYRRKIGYRDYLTTLKIKSIKS